MKTLLGVLLLSPSLLFAQQSAALSGSRESRDSIRRGHSITFTRTDQGELTLLAPSVRTPF